MIMKNIYKGSMKTSASEATHFEHFYKFVKIGVRQNSIRIQRLTPD